MSYRGTSSQYHRGMTFQQGIRVRIRVFFTIEFIFLIEWINIWWKFLCLLTCWLIHQKMDFIEDKRKYNLWCTSGIYSRTPPYFTIFCPKIKKSKIPRMSIYRLLTSCKISEKNNEPIERKVHYSLPDILGLFGQNFGPNENFPKIWALIDLKPS